MSELLKRMLEASANSPLAEADPTSLDELMERIHIIFNKPALDTTDKDIVDTMLYFRTKRALVATLARERADKEPKTKRNKTKAPTISSEDMGI